MSDETKVRPCMSLRDPNEATNQTVPLSMRSSGQELDECCSGPNGEILEASAGKMALDNALTFLRK